jgi:hypothetical protein
MYISSMRNITLVRAFISHYSANFSSYRHQQEYERVQNNWIDTNKAPGLDLYLYKSKRRRKINGN